jgi:hypothetical protein
MGSVNEIKERRFAIMATVRISWKDQAGHLRDAIGKIEDISTSGACIRMSVSIRVGSELSVKWQKENFSGVVKYCRRDGQEYVLGLQKYKATSDVRPAAATGNAEGKPAPPEADGDRDTWSNERAEPRTQTGAIPLPSNNDKAMAAPSHNTTVSSGGTHELVDREPQEPLSSAQMDIRSTEAQPQKSSQVQERKTMLEKWLNRAGGRNPQEAPVASTNGKHSTVETQFEEAVSVNHPNANANGKGPAIFQSDLLSPEDIYRAAGIMSLRLGYGINTVVEMLNSDHIRSLSSEVKRAAVLMALETAGIPIDEILRDAAERQEAINLYEASQRKHLEEYEVRKKQENLQIQGEIDRITAHHIDRMKHNLSEVSLAKETFGNWQASKQKEVQGIAEAASLCVKQQPAPVAAPESVVAMQATGFITKP